MTKLFQGLRPGLCFSASTFVVTALVFCMALLLHTFSCPHSVGNYCCYYIYMTVATWHKWVTKCSTGMYQYAEIQVATPTWVNQAWFR